MTYDLEKVDQAVLALLSLTLHDANAYGARAWKGHDWGVMERLHEQGWIDDPVSRAKSVALTPEAVAESKRLFEALFGARPDGALEGTWHIGWMEMWEPSYLHMERQAFLEVGLGGTGEFQFGLVHGYLDGRLEDGRFAFTWEGNDEMDPATGSGWIALAGDNEARGILRIHHGDTSEFRARRAA